MNPFYKSLCFPTGSTITNSYHLYFISLYHIANLLHGNYLLILRRVRIDCIIVKQSSLSIETYHFTPCSESGINSKSPFLSDRCSKKQPLYNYRSCEILSHTTQQFF